MKMGKVSFTSWLTREMQSSMMALITAIENRDHLLYSESDKIRREYMEKIGYYEKDVLESELEAGLLRKKEELVQTYINRRQPVDMEKIDAFIDARRKEIIADVEADEKLNGTHAPLSNEQEEALRLMYKEIISAFHPSVNHNMTELQKDAYEKAVTAYKTMNIETMCLVYDMLFSERNTAMKPNDYTADENMSAEQESALSDYGIAAELFDCFVPLERDMLIKAAWDDYKSRTELVEEETEQIKSSFPFNAVETLRDPKKTEEYIDGLKIRHYNSQEEIRTLSDEISEMLGENRNA